LHVQLRFAFNLDDEIIEHLHFELGALFDKTSVHAEEISAPNFCFVAAGTLSNFDNAVRDLSRCLF